MPPLLNAAPSKMILRTLETALVEYCKAEDISVYQLDDVKVTLKDLLPHLKKTNRAWAAVEPEHLDVKNNTTISIMAKAVDETKADSETMKMLLGIDDSIENHITETPGAF